MCRPWQTAGASAAVIFRKVDKEKPTLLLDESDAAFNGSDEYAETLRGVLNAGFKKTGKISRCEGKGADMSYRDYSCFGAKAIAGIGKLPDTIASRSIAITMRRKTRGEVVERFRMRVVHAKAKPIRDALERWARKHLAELRGATPDLPEQMADRQQDIAEPLIAIADLAGGDWPDHLRGALLDVFGQGSAEDGSYRVRLLKDVRDAFGEHDRISSAGLVDHLMQVDGQPWQEWNKGKGIDPNALAKRLKEFHIYSRNIRIGSITPKGYLRQDFEDAWERYCPHTPSQTRHTATTRVNTGDLEENEPPQETACGGSKSDENTHEYSAVAVWRQNIGNDREQEENSIVLLPVTGLINHHSVARREF